MDAELKTMLNEINGKLDQLLAPRNSKASQQGFTGPAVEDPDPLVKPATPLVGLIKPSNFFPSGQNPLTGKGWQNQAEYDAYVLSQK